MSDQGNGFSNGRPGDANREPPTSDRNQRLVARTHVLTTREPDDNRQAAGSPRKAGNRRSNLVELSRSVIASARQGVVSQKEFKHFVTNQFEYPQLERGDTGMSESLVAAFNPYSAKGRAIRYLAARIMLENASLSALSFSVAGAHRKCGTSYIAANLAVAFSEFGLRTMLVDANLEKPSLQRLFGFPQAEGLSTVSATGGSASPFVIRMPLFRNLSLLPSGRRSRRVTHLLGNGVLANQMHAMRRDYDVVICDSPALSKSGQSCEVVAAICHNVLSVMRKDETRLTQARELLASLDAVGSKPLGSVLCEF